MKVEKVELSGVCKPNKSKSVLIRLITILALNEGGVVRGYDDSNDVRDIINALKTIGFKIEVKDDLIYISKGKLENKLIEIKESGTVFRFLACLLSLYFDEFKIKVNGTLKTRKLYLLNEYEFDGEVYTLKKIKDIDTVDLNYTSQNLSALLIYYSLKEDKTLKVIGDKSISYALMTMNILNDLGAKISFSDNTFIIKKTVIKYQEVESEDDMTSLSNLLVLACLHPKVKVKTSLAKYQADKVVFEFLEEMGYYFKEENGLYSLDHFEKKECKLDFKNNIDLTIALAALALLRLDNVMFVGVKNLMYKEVDRLQAIRNIMAYGGALYMISDNMIRFDRPINKTNLNLKSLNDHRTAMMNLIILSKIGGTIDDVSCINKSFREFVTIYKSLGGVLSDN